MNKIYKAQKRSAVSSGGAIAAGTTITATTPIVTVAPASAITMTAEPTFTNGTVDGQELTVINTTTNALMLQDVAIVNGSKLRLMTPRLVLGHYESAKFVWLGGKWNQAAAVGSEDGIRPEMFGAVGNGIADDYIPIMAAFTAAWAAKLPVLLRARTYGTGTEIDLPNGRHTVIKGSQYVDGAVSTIKAIAPMRAVLSLNMGIVMETMGIDANRQALIGIYGQTCSLGTFKNMGVGSALRDGIFFAGENDTTVHASGGMTLEMARFLRGDNRMVKSISTLAGVQCNTTNGNAVVTFTGDVDLTTLSLEGGPNDPSSIIIKDGDSIWRGAVLSIDSPTQLTVQTSGFWTAPNFTAEGADFIMNNFRHAINDTNHFFDVGCGGNGTIWVTAGSTGIYFDPLLKIVSTETASVTQGSAVVNFTGDTDLYAMKLRYGDGIRVGSEPWSGNQPMTVGMTRYNDTRTYRCITAGTTAGSGGPTGTGSDITDGTVHWEFLHAGGLKQHMLIYYIVSPTQLVAVNTFDFTGEQCDWAIASGDGFHECQSSDNNLNSFSGNTLWRGNANCHMSFRGFYGPYVIGQQMDYAGFYGISVGLGTVCLNPMFIRNYNEAAGSGKAFFIGTAQGISIHQPTDLFGVPDDNIDYVSGGGGCFGIYHGRDGIFELGQGAGGYRSDIMASRIGPNPAVHGLMSLGARELLPDSLTPPPPPEGAFSTTGTTSFTEHCNVLNPNNTDYTLTGTPTFTLTGGRLILLSVKQTQSGRVTLQDETFLTGTKLRLSSNRVSLGPGHSMLLYCDGISWYEIGRTPAVNQTRCVASGGAIYPGQIVAAVYDAAATSPLKARNVAQADANGAGTLTNPIGASPGIADFGGTHFDIQSSGEMHVPDNVWVGGVPVITDVGKLVYLSETAGSWTMTAPTTSGSTVVRMGTITVGGAGLVMVLVKIGDPTVNP